MKSYPGDTSVQQANQRFGDTSVFKCRQADFLFWNFEFKWSAAPPISSEKIPIPIRPSGTFARLAWLYSAAAKEARPVRAVFLAQSRHLVQKYLSAAS